MIPGSMEQLVSLGAGGPKVSRIGLGVWQASGEWKGDDDEVIQAIMRAHELGVNLVDTAEAYGGGHSEKVLSKAIKLIGRDNLIVATKVNGAHLRYDELQRACRASRERLQIKEIDLYQVHWPDPWEQIPLKHTMRAMDKLYREGKIRWIGVSNFAVRDLEEARSFLSGADIVSNQVRYNLLQREVEEEVLPYCRKEGIGILAWSPLAQGALTGKYGVGNVPTGDIRRGNQLFAAANLKQITKIIPVLSKVAKAHRKTIAQVDLAWISSKSVVPIPGAKNIQQSEENAGAMGLRLSNAEVEEIEHACDRVKLDYLLQANP
jgi:myo-inositol catabolism protein IolS